MKTLKRLGCLTITMAVMYSIAGCSQPNDGLSKNQRQQTNRLDQISKQSGGDWSKVSSADKAYVLNTFASGNEQTAKMLLLAKSGKLRGTPGGVTPH